MACDRLRNEVAVRDLDLLLKDVAWNADDLHPVEQGRRDRRGDVGRAEEEHAREVHGHVQVEVPEGRVLRRVQGLQQRGGGVSPHVPAQLVDLVDEDHGVGDLRDLQGLHELARHRAHVRAPVAADLGHVLQAAHGETEEAPVQRARDALSYRRLAHARRPGQAHDLALGLALEEGHGHVLEDALLDVVEAAVVLVEDPLRLIDVRALLRGHAPGQRRHPLQVGPADVELGRRLLEAFHPGQLLPDGVARLLGQALELGGCLLQRGDDGLLVVLVEVELLPELLELLGEEELPHLLRVLVLDARLELGLQPRALDVGLGQRQRPAQPRVGRSVREHGLQLVAGRQREAGHEVGQHQRVVHVAVLEQPLELGLVREGRLHQLLHRRDELLVHGPHVLGAAGVLGRRGLGHGLDVGGTEREALGGRGERPGQAQAPRGLHEEPAARAGHVLGEAHDAQEGADLRQLAAGGHAGGVRRPLGRLAVRGRPRGHEAGNVLCLATLPQGSQEFENIRVRDLNLMLEAREKRLQAEGKHEQRLVAGSSHLWPAGPASFQHTT
mmetsp:Transcript_13945/g.40701  ORF Transcript_13945/g.40701 Transcript_13945/m.40701 type:complete len:555 (+) Transcript_13945:632-2296(+)